MHMGKRPEQEQDPDSRRTARRHDQRPRIDDGQRQQQPRQAHQAQQITPPRWAADRPPPRSTGTQAPPAPPRSTAVQPHGQPQPHRARTADATPPRTPTGPAMRPTTTIYTHHRRQPASGQRWTTGPAAGNTPDAITARTLLVIDFSYIYSQITGQL